MLHLAVKKTKDPLGALSGLPVLCLRSSAGCRTQQTVHPPPTDEMISERLVTPAGMPAYSTSLGASAVHSGAPNKPAPAPVWS